MIVSRTLWAVLAVICLGRIYGQPIVAEFEFPQTTLAGAYNFTITLTLDYTEAVLPPSVNSTQTQPKRKLVEDSVLLYWRIIYHKGDEEFPAAGEGAEGSMPARDSIGNLVSTVEITNVQARFSGKHDGEVRLSYDPSFESYTASTFTMWSIPPLVSIIPPVLTLILAIITQDVIISLFVGIYSAAFITRAYNPIVAWLRTFDYYILTSFADTSHIYVISFSWFLAGMVANMTRSGGGHGLAEAIGKFAKNRYQGALFACLVSLCIFFDDYSNVLITGSSMRPITDMLYISREKLAFICDSGSAPISSISPISSWVGFEVSQIQLGMSIAEQQGFDLEAMGYPTNAYVVFLKTIIARFYPLYMIVLVWFTILLKREFGPMLLAERRAIIEHKVYSDTARVAECELSSSIDPLPDTPRRWWNGVIPIVSVVFITLLSIFLTGKFAAIADGEDGSSLNNMLSYADSFASLVYSTFTTSAIAWVLYRLQYKKDKKIVAPRLFGGPKGGTPLMTVTESLRVWIEGIRNLMAAIITLLLAWGIGLAIRSVGCDVFMSSVLSSAIDPRLMPLLTFSLAGVISLATGTSWGTMSIMFPIVIPTIVRAAPGDLHLFYLTVAGVLAGAVFGDHCTPISDTTILSAMAAKCDLRHHVITQLPYALLAGMYSALLGYLPAGYGWYPDWAAILIGWAAVIITIFLLMPKVDGKRKDPLAWIIAKTSGHDKFSPADDDAGFKDVAASYTFSVDDEDKEIDESKVHVGARKQHSSASPVPGMLREASQPTLGRVSSKYRKIGMKIKPQDDTTGVIREEGEP